MGTSGTMAFVIDGETKAQYVHSDGYPDSLGCDVLKWLRSGIDSAKTREAISALKVIDHDSPQPTPDERDALVKYSNLNVSEQSLTDWYCLLRECQGDAALTLESGYILGGRQVETYRLGYGSEYTYIIDCDAKTFSASGYGHEIGRWSFAALPTLAEFLKQAEEEDE